ncbi:MAG: leucine-rich repeat domain-containing protein [Pleurocapsa sp. SU_196_0]|nr:leucine-rich repeat domain-containing protein [Pleurocapsa sp. SU_196_0]
MPSFYDETEGLSPKVLSLEGRLEWDAVREFMFARKNPLRKGFVFSAPEPEPAPQPRVSELHRRVRQLAEGDDTEGLTRLLETWEDRDAEWEQFVQSRLYAPSTTDEQKTRLKLVLDAAKPVSPEARDAAPPEIQALIESIKREGVTATLKALQAPPERTLLEAYSQWLLMEVVDKIRAGYKAHLKVLERLLELGVNPRADKGSVYQYVAFFSGEYKTETLELMHHFAPELEGVRIAQPVVQVATFKDAHRDVQRVVEAMDRGVKPTLTLLENPSEPELFPNHSHVLLSNAMLKNKDAPGKFLPVIRRLLELGVNPYFEDATGRDLVDDSLLWDQPDVADVFREHFPDNPIWTIPSSGQMQEPEEAHPSILELLNISDNPDNPEGKKDWEVMLEALETPPDSDLIRSHSWFLLINLVQRTSALNSGYAKVIGRLLELDADPRASFEGMNMGVIRQTELLKLNDVLELFYEHFPELRPESAKKMHGVEILHQLIKLEDEHADFTDPDVQHAWIELVTHLRVVVETLERIPEALGKLSHLKTLEFACIDPPGSSLPDSLNDLVDLEELVLGASAFMKIPDLSRLMKLRELSVHMNQLETLTALPSNLEELKLDYNPWKQIPNLSALKQLKNLS